MLAFTPRLHRAVYTAALAHHGQFRKDQDAQIPYVAHVFGVAYILAEFGFDEDVVIAGLLHDVLEDQPQFAAEVAGFGERVHALVQGVTERKKDTGGADIPWADRKAAYIEHLRGAPPEVRALSCADKIHNMQSMLLALERAGDKIWGAMKAGPDKQLNRFRKLREVVGDGWQHPILDRYDATLQALERRIRESQV